MTYCVCMHDLETIMNTDIDKLRKYLADGRYAASFAGIHQSGRWYTNENIDGLLMERHMAKVARRKSKNHLKGPAKRTDEDDRRFEESFRRLIDCSLRQEGTI